MSLHAIGKLSAIATVRTLVNLLDDSALTELSTDVRDGTVDPFDALKQCRLSKGPRLWRSAAWRSRRVQLLGNTCQCCSSTDGPFLLQHVVQPPRPYELLESYIQPAWREFYSALPYPGQIHTEVRNTCPKCGSRALQERTTLLPRYICRGQSDRQYCLHVFDEPNTAEFTKRIFDEAQAKRNREAFEGTSAYRRLAAAAVVEYIEHVREYLTLKHVQTFCKKCAFLWDMKNLRPCTNCGKGWAPEGTHCVECSPNYILCERCGGHRHHKRFPTCYECNVLDVGSGALNGGR